MESVRSMERMTVVQLRELAREKKVARVSVGSVDKIALFALTFNIL